MIVTTTQNVEGRQIAEYKGIVFGEVVSGVNFVKDMFSSIKAAFRAAFLRITKIKKLLSRKLINLSSNTKRSPQ